MAPTATSRLSGGRSTKRRSAARTTTAARGRSTSGTARYGTHYFARSRSKIKFDLISISDASTPPAAGCQRHGVRKGRELRGRAVRASEGCQIGQDRPDGRHDHQRRRVQLGPEPDAAHDQRQHRRDAGPARDVGPAAQGRDERQRRRHRERLRRRLRHALPHLRLQDHLCPDPARGYGRGLALLLLLHGHDRAPDGDRRRLGRDLRLPRRVEGQRDRHHVRGPRDLPARHVRVEGRRDRGEERGQRDRQRHGVELRQRLLGLRSSLVHGRHLPFCQCKSQITVSSGHVSMSIDKTIYTNPTPGQQVYRALGLARVQRHGLHDLELRLHCHPDVQARVGQLRPGRARGSRGREAVDCLHPDLALDCLHRRLLHAGLWLHQNRFLGSVFWLA